MTHPSRVTLQNKVKYIDPIKHIKHRIDELCSRKSADVIEVLCMEVLLYVTK